MPLALTALFLLKRVQDAHRVLDHLHSLTLSYDADDFSPERRKSSGLHINGPRSPIEQVARQEAKNVVDLTTPDGKAASGKSCAPDGGRPLLQVLGKVAGTKEPIGEDDDYDLADEYDVHYSRLRELGPQEYLRETVTLAGMTLRQIASIFGEDPRKDEDVAVDAYLPKLEKSLTRELKKRNRLPRPNTLDHVAWLLKTQRNILVITGAGISTSVGIPDFRSKDTGFFAKLQEMGYDDPMELLDIDNFNEDPSKFYKVAVDFLLAQNKLHSPTHHFIKTLQDQGRLLNNYTQNIDNLETTAGLNQKRFVQCHGSFATAQCLKCHQLVPGTAIYADIHAKRVPRCKACIERITAKQAAKSNSTQPTRTSSRKRSAKDAGVDDPDPYASAGVMKPGIIMYGEHVGDFCERMIERDRHKADMVLVLGTSLKVAPVSKICELVAPNVPQIYVGRERNADFGFDVQLLGECDEIVAALCNAAGWMFSHPMTPIAFQATTEKVGNVPGVWRVVEKEMVGGNELL
ncbi:hypothetical protein MBLNU230_g1051t1 [Neophaeotheca triangularis]